MFYNEENDDTKKEEKNEGGGLDFLKKTRTIIISGEVDQKLAEKVTTALLYLQELSDDPIKLIVNTPGGHVESGYTIHDMIKFVRPKVYVIGSGWVASAGVLIYLAAAKEERLTLPNTRFLIHQPSGGARGSASDIEIEAGEIIKMREHINGIISRETGQSIDKVKEDSDRNFWLSADEAVEYGVVGKIISHVDEIGK